MTEHKSMILLAAESATHEGTTAETLPDALKVMPTYAITRDAFLLKLPSGLTFHYVQGKGVTVSRPDSVSDLEVALFLNGSVYGAIAWINGLVPLHASGVVHDGTVHAFTGHSGAGKSTLAAALGSRGLPLLADDVLVLDLSDPSCITCLPGHKQLKLWGDAVKMTGLEASTKVRDGLDKYYITPAAGFHAGPLPLSHLYILDNQTKAKTSFTPVMGSERFTLAQTAFYRPQFHAAIAENQNLFNTLSRLAQQVRIARFDRPRRKDLFDEGVEMMAAAIKAA
jgi:hypothetical protein